MTTSSLQVSVSATDLTDGSSISFRTAALTNSSPVARRTTDALSSGANTLTVPSGATSVLVIPPAGNAVLLTLKGVTGDTGIAFKTGAALIPLDTTQTSLCLTAGSAIAAGLVTIWFW